MMKGLQRIVTGIAVLMVSGTILNTAAAAQAAVRYPDRPIRLIVPYPPGGTADVMARIVGVKLAEKWNRSVVVDNRGGAGGNIATEMAARAEGDGYTLLL
jgi:tripartite-type tricarboxylate transporter receptor subunit TctC